MNIIPNFGHDTCNYTNECKAEPIYDFRFMRKRFKICDACFEKNIEKHPDAKHWFTNKDQFKIDKWW